MTRGIVWPLLNHRLAANKSGSPLDPTYAKMLVQGFEPPFGQKYRSGHFPPVDGHERVLLLLDR